MQKYILYGVSDIIMKNTVPKCEMKIKEEAGEILYFCDINSELWCEEKRIYSPEKIKENPEAIVVVLCTAVKQVVHYLRKNQIENTILVYPHFGFSFYVDEYNAESASNNRIWITEHEEKLKKIYNSEDQYTKNVLMESIAQRSLDHLEFLNIGRTIDFPSVITYFYDDSISPQGDVTLIDGGAFTGDSIELLYQKYGDRLKKVYAFEPSHDNVRQMKSNLKRLGIEQICEYLEYGLHNEDGSLWFDCSNAGELGHISSEGNLKIDVKALDNVPLNVIGDLMIKMDIEGAELSALRGAKETIKKYSPFMAICVYHKMKDILEIPEYIYEINPEYDFYLRAGMHLECYAVPKRQKRSSF